MANLAISAENILDAVEDGKRLWPHNSEVVADKRVERAVLAALSIPFEFADDGLPDMPDVNGQTLIVSCKEDNCVMPVLDAMTNLFVMHHPCDRCALNVQPCGRLWVNAGATIVEVACCARCVKELNRDFPNIVWR
ncbi:MAG: hypothetical protein V9G04_14125 [Nocardioides sp.]|jgi:hypothetical protein